MGQFGFPSREKKYFALIAATMPAMRQVDTSDADVIKKTKGTLNKLTPERFDKLLAQFKPGLSSRMWGPKTVVRN